MHKKFTWSEKYSVGVVEIDGQHQQYLEICNSLIELLGKGSFTREKAKSEVMRLGDYAFYHLSTEEEMFSKTDYPDAEIHTAIHNKFREKTTEFINNVRDEGSDVRESVEKVAVFAGEWLLQHILAVDQRYSEHFNSHGIK